MRCSNGMIHQIDAVLFPGHLYSVEPSATMGETRKWNYVFKPGSEQEWLAMFGQ